MSRHAFCVACGKDLLENESVCPNCGQVIAAPPAGSSTKSRSEFWTCLVIFLFFVVGIPSCLFGGCVLLVAGDGAGYYTVARGDVLKAVFAIVIFLGLLVAVIRNWKRGRHE